MQFWIHLLGDDKCKGLGNTSLRITILLFALATLLHTADVFAQKVYSLGGASILQTINFDDLKVVDYATLVPAMSDIAFHADGTMYGVNENTIYKIDTVNGSSDVIKQLPSAFGWLVGLTIDHNGVFFMSSLGVDQDYIIRYDPLSDVAVNLGSTGWRHWDLEFYRGALYLSGGTDNSNEGFLIHADISDPSKSRVILDFGAQAYGITSFNTICGSTNLVAVTSQKMIRLHPENSTFASGIIGDPLFTYSSGAASRTSYLGSLLPLTIDFVHVGTAPCDPGATTSVEIRIGPGRSGVQYSVDGINYQSSPYFADIPVGVYQAFIRDDLGCTDMSDPFEIKVPQLTFTTQSIPAQCGEENGVVIPSAAFANDSLEFSINGVIFYGDAEFNSLAGGSYTIYARNKSGCTDSVLVVVDVVPDLTHTSTTTPEHCDKKDGTIEVFASGGQEPYSYAIEALPFQATPLFTDIQAATVLVRVMDMLGCVTENLVDVIVAPTPVVTNIIVSEAHCGMPDGSAEIIAIPASGALEYAINSGPFSSNALFENLEPGMYDLIVSDEFGCDTTTSFIIPAIEGPVIQNVLVKNDYCNSGAGSIEIDAYASSGELTYSINNGSFTPSSVFSGLNKGVYQVAVRDDFGCDALENVTVDEEPQPRIELTESVDATCGESNGSIRVIQSGSVDGEYSLNNIDFRQQGLFTELAPGDYTAYLIDNNGCIDSVMTSITMIEQAKILDISITDASCEGDDGIMTINSNVSSDYLQYSIDGSNFQVNEIFTGLKSNNYTGYLIDDNGCLDSMAVTIYGQEAVILKEITTTPAYCNDSDGSITIYTEEKVYITLDNGNTYSSGLISGLDKGVYNVNITNDSQCSLDTIVEIVGITCNAIPDSSTNIFVPNAFSPNGDGINDVLSPYFNVSLFQLLQFQIRDRWGNEVFNCSDFCEWDGHSSGEYSPSGVYVYRLQIKDQNGLTMELSGDVTLLR